MSTINPNLKHTRRSNQNLQYYIDGLSKGDRYVLGEAITLIESTDSSKRKLALDILRHCHHHKPKQTQRIAITGSPGVGKSTFIEALGQLWTKEGHRVAVLAIDPSSSLSSGSILGDKTRMERLSQDMNAFIRPSPAGKTLGGIAKNTKEAIQLCEFAGFSKLIIETVGVGQSETLVSEMVDFFVLLILPGSGDEVQGIKRGIMELADLLVINKADGDRISLAKEAKRAYKNALHLMSPRHPKWTSPVLTASGLEGSQIPEVSNHISRFYSKMKRDYIQTLRHNQDTTWFMHQSKHSVLAALMEHSMLGQKIDRLTKEIEKGKTDPYTALESITQLIMDKIA